MTAKRCPTPEKVKYPNYWTATNAMRHLPAGRPECGAYKCRKHWHLTSRPKR